MKIAIIGAGFTGLSAAYRLCKEGHDVTIFEKDSHVGGLAIGYQEKNWDWTLEEHYHHWFTNDEAVLGLAREIHFPVIIARPKSCFYVNGKIYQLDTPTKFLTFPLLTLFERIRMLSFFAFLKLNPFWKTLENMPVNTTVPRLMGKKAYDMLWRPQLTNKMGKFADVISLVWFWARIVKRTPSLAYPAGGFYTFALAVTDHIKKMGGKFIFNAGLESVNGGDHPTVTVMKSGKKKIEQFDRVIVTLPTNVFAKTAIGLPEDYKKYLTSLKGIGASNMVLRLKKPFFTDNTYWLSICEMNAPVMVVVEHTNFMSPDHYHNEHLLYIGNYLEADSPNFTKSKAELLKIYKPLLEKLHPGFEKDIIDYEVFRAPFAQPIVPVNYSMQIPPMKTPLQNVYLANMQQVYPWDRGTNYAVELGEKAAKLISK